MTVNKNLKITCDGCNESKTWALSVLQSRSLNLMLENEGFTKESNGLLEPNYHYCPDCNDREKETFHVIGGYGEEYLGTVEAWGIADARKSAWDKFECEHMIREEKPEL